MPRGKSLYHEYPDYRVDLEPSSKRIRVELNGELIAESDRTLIVRETRHDPVVYFPRDTVRFDRLERTDHETFEEVAGLKDYVAFYPDRVDWHRDS